MTCEKTVAKLSATFRVCVVLEWLSKFSRNLSPPVCRRGCTVSPEKGGALRNQSTGGRRLGVAAVICGTLLGAPLLLLQNATAHASRSEVAAGSVRDTRAGDVHAASTSDGVKLPSHLVAYHAPATTTTTTAPCAHDHDVVRTGHNDDDRAAPPPPHHHDDRSPSTPTDDHDDDRTAALPVPAAQANQEDGEATWYSEAASGTCASPTLAVRDGAHGGQRRHRSVDGLHRRRPRGGRLPPGGRHVARMASSRSPTSAREWWTSQSPGDPFRCRHRPDPVDARTASQPGPRAELRRRPQHRPAHRPSLGRHRRFAGARDRGGPRVADAGPGRDGGQGGGGGDRPPPGPRAALGGRAGRRRGRRGGRPDPRPGGALGRAWRRDRGAWWPTCPTTWRPPWSCVPWSRCRRSAHLLVMVQREVGERMAAGAGEDAYGAVSVRIAYFARAEVVGRVPASVFVPRPRVESVLVRLERLPAPAVDPRAWSPTSGWTPWCGPASHSGARCCGGRWPASWTRRPSSGPGCVPTPGPRSSASPNGEGWRRRERRAGSGEADRDAAGDRGAARRLPRARRRDGHVEPGRRAGVRRRGSGPGRRPPSRGRGPATCLCPTGQPDRARPRGMRPHCRGAPHEADPVGRRARWRVGGRGGRAALGRAVPTCWLRPRWGPTCPSAWSGAGPGSKALGERVTPLPFEARDYLLLLPPFGVDTAAGLPGLGRGPGGRGAQRAGGGRPGRRASSGPLARRPGGPGRQRAGAGRQWVDVVRRGGTGGGRDAVEAELRLGGRNEPGWCGPTPCRRAGKGTEKGRSREPGAGNPRGSREPAKLLAGPALPAGGLQHLLVLLLAHPLAALLDQ